MSMRVEVLNEVKAADPSPGPLALAGAWHELDDQAVDALVEEIYATRHLDTGRPAELED